MYFLSPKIAQGQLKLFDAPRFRNTVITADGVFFPHCHAPQGLWVKFSDYASPEELAKAIVHASSVRDASLRQLASSIDPTADSSGPVPVTKPEALEPLPECFCRGCR